MPAFRGHLSPEQVVDVIAWVRSLARPRFRLEQAPPTAAVPNTPRQPIFFSHLIHAGSFQIPCQYCHADARRAGICGMEMFETEVADRVKDLKQAIQDHVEEEEGELFEVARRLGADERRSGVIRAHIRGADVPPAARFASATEGERGASPRKNATRCLESFLLVRNRQGG